MDRIALFGSGYIGEEFARHLDEWGFDWKQVPHTADLERALDGVDVVINAAGYTGKPNVDACEDHKKETIEGNIFFPAMLVAACERRGITLGHVSSGCIYTGKRPDGSGFTEEDAPNFTFAQGNCSFYSGTKDVAERIVAPYERAFIWRLRIPFDHIDNPRNYLTKLLRYERLLDAENSLSHRGEFVHACVDMLCRDVPFGTYNVVNTGAVTTRDVVEMLKGSIAEYKEFAFFRDEEEFYREAAKTPRSNCVLDNSKLLATGIEMSDVRDALEESIRDWS